MKPRTKMQVEVMKLSQNYTINLKDEQFEWAYEHCLDHFGFATKHTVHCMDCGQPFPNENVEKTNCPHCGHELKIIKTRRRTTEQKEYMAFAEIIGEYQVFRYFLITSQHRAGWRRELSSYEVLQHWIHSNGKRQVVSRRHHQSYWSWSDSWGGDLEIRDHRDKRRYDILHTGIHPWSYFKPEYTKYGIGQDFKLVTLLDSIRLISSSSMCETLCKTKQWSLLLKSEQSFSEVYRHWPSIKLCIRNGVIIEDAGIFIDYLDLLRHFGKDLRSPKYLFPVDLKAEHDRLVEKKREQQRREDLEKKRKKAAMNDKEYQEAKQPFLGLSFSEGDITVSVLQSVQEFVEIGDKLKHCVFTNEYYKKADSLILSATINGEPVETVEVSLDKLKVIQSRGLQNKQTEHNEKIIKLVNRNMGIIKQIHTKNANTENGTNQKNASSEPLQHGGLLPVQPVHA